MDLFLDNSKNSQWVKLLAHYTNLVTRQKVSPITLNQGTLSKKLTGETLQLPNCPFLVTEDGHVESNPLQIAHILTYESFTQEILFKQDESFEFSSILETCHTIGKQPLQFLEHFNQYLSDRVYIVGVNITLGDIILFGYAYQYFSLMHDTDKVKYNHFFRWYYQIQSLPGIQDYIASQKLAVCNFPEDLQVEVGGKKKK